MASRGIIKTMEQTIENPTKEIELIKIKEAKTNLTMGTEEMTSQDLGEAPTRTSTMSHKAQNQVKSL